MSARASAPQEARVAEQPARKSAAHPLIAIEVDENAPVRNPVGAFLYRALEIAVTAVAIVVSLPIILVEALVIRLDSPGPAFFFQTRFGRSRIMRGAELAGRTDIISATGRFEPDKRYHVPTTFRFVKFRTMYADAKERTPDLYRYEFASHEEFRAAFYKLDNDPRVTRVGRWLRKSTLDELPNLWNVLTGKVALVGPRPENTVYLPFYSAEEMKKFTVRPGITGLAVINGRGELNIGGQIDWDLTYVRERSVLLDLKTIFATVWMVIVRRGAF